MTKSHVSIFAHNLEVYYKRIPRLEAPNFADNLTMLMMIDSAVTNGFELNTREAAFFCACRDPLAQEIAEKKLAKKEGCGERLAGIIARIYARIRKDNIKKWNEYAKAEVTVQLQAMGAPEHFIEFARMRVVSLISDGMPK